MTRTDDEILHDWQAVVDTVEAALKGMSESALDIRVEAQGWSIREFVHHVVESNMVASNIMLAALAKPGMVYDWSWVIPNLAWAQRLGYRKVPVQPAIHALRALTCYFAAVIQASADGLSSEVQLLDSAGAELYCKSVRAILVQEIELAAEHLEEVALMRRTLGE